MTFVWVVICLLFKAFDFACCEVQIGTTTPDNRMNGSIIIVVKTDLERCGRVCLYQDQCVAINHNSNTSICELLKSEENLEESPGFSYSNITTWTMTNDPCYPNPCSNMTSCRKACHGPGSGGYYCTTFETPCDQSECQNNATCINGLNSYTCRCPEGYFGDRCQDKLCFLNFCLNGGICIEGRQSSYIFTFTCLCPDGYNGSMCPVDGGWQDWAFWGTCSSTCGGGSQSRFRSCSNPFPQHGGNDCVGEISETQDCNTQNC